MFVAVLTILSQGCSRNSDTVEGRNKNIELTSAIPENFEFSKQRNGKEACPSVSIKMPLTKHERCITNKFGKLYFNTWCTESVISDVKPVNRPNRSLASISTNNRQMEAYWSVDSLRFCPLNAPTILTPYSAK